MRTLVAVFLHWLHHLALGVWLGGILILGGVAAPAIFGAAKAQGQTTLQQPLYRFAGEAMGSAFSRFNTVAVIAGCLVVVSGLLYARAAELCFHRTLVRAGLSLLALGIAAYLTFFLYPTLLAARSAGEMDTFDGLHRTYTQFSLMEAVLLTTVTALSGWMHLDRSRTPVASSLKEGMSDAGAGAVAREPGSARVR